MGRSNRLLSIVSSLAVFVPLTAGTGPRISAPSAGCRELILGGDRQAVNIRAGRRAGVLSRATATFRAAAAVPWICAVRGIFRERVSSNGKAIQGTLTLHFLDAPFTAADSLTVAYTQSLLDGPTGNYGGPWSIVRGTGVFAQADVTRRTDIGVPPLIVTSPDGGAAETMRLSADRICFRGGRGISRTERKATVTRPIRAALLPCPCGPAHGVNERRFDAVIGE